MNRRGDRLFVLDSVGEVSVDPSGRLLTTRRYGAA